MKKKILIEILNRDESFWKKYVQELNHNAEISIGRVGHAVFPKIWLLDNYDILISQAFELLVLKTNKYVFMRHMRHMKVFLKQMMQLQKNVESSGFIVISKHTMMMIFV